MYDQGFRAIEDNGMKGREISDQERIAKKMEQLGMKMGVFVAHKIYWQEPNLANGDPEMREEFFKQDRDERSKLRDEIENTTRVKDLDFFEIEDDGKDFKVTMRTEFSISKLSEDAFADAMDRLNIAGGSIEDAWNEYFDKLTGD